MRLSSCCRPLASWVTFSRLSQRALDGGKRNGKTSVHSGAGGSLDREIKDDTVLSSEGLIDQTFDLRVENRRSGAQT